MKRLIAVAFVFLSVVVGLAETTWVHKFTLGEGCPCWYLYRKSQKAECWTDPGCWSGKLPEGILNLKCLDDEKWPDFIGIQVKITVKTLANWREMIGPVNSLDNISVQLLDAIAKLGHSGLFVQVIDPGTLGVLDLCGKTSEGEWELAGWGPQFIQGQKGALLILSPDTVEIDWRVEVYLYAYENYWSGSGIGHRGVLCMHSMKQP